MTQDKNKKSFMKSVSIILFAQVAVKLLGMIYRIVITNIKGFGDAGNGYYHAGYQVYTLLLAISSVGIPNAISKMVSAKTACEDYAGAHRIFKTALGLFACVGLACTLILFLGAEFISVNIINMEGAKYTLRALSPAVFFVCTSSVISGYFMGLGNMKATSSSQILEQLFKCTITILIVVMLVGQSPELMAAGANFATAIATFLSFIYLVMFYLVSRKGIWENLKGGEGEKEPLRKVVVSILAVAIPISLSSIINAVTRIVDIATITRGIEVAFSGGIPGVEGIPTLEDLKDVAAQLSGRLSKSDTFINLPLAMNIALSMTLVPTISAAFARGDKKEASNKISYSLLISVLLVLPCAVGYIALGKPIYAFLYPNASLGGDLLQISAVALIFMALNQTMAGALQGMGKIITPAIGLLCGTTAKVILNLILIRIPSVNIYGAAISTIVCHIIAFSISFSVLSKNIDLKLNLVKNVLKPLAASVIMGVCAIVIYRLLSLFAQNVVALLLSIALSAVIYVLLVLVFRILSKEDAEMLPFASRIPKKFIR